MPPKRKHSELKAASFAPAWEGYGIYFSTDDESDSVDGNGSRKKQKIDKTSKVVDVEELELPPSTDQDEVFSMTGPLTTSKMFCCLSQVQRDRLASKNDYLDDEIINMALFHVSNFFPELRNQVEVIPTGWINNWLGKKARQIPKAKGKKPKKPIQTLPTPPACWRTRRLIAYPVHSPNHWTLGILVNKSWPQEGENWVAFHFDSYKCNKHALPTALAFGQYITGIKHRHDLPIKEVSVPQQKSHSNDCGLWAAHYLKVFLKNIEFFIDYCNSDKVSPEKRDQIWEVETTSVLRKLALNQFDFYKSAWQAAIQSQAVKA